MAMSDELNIGETGARLQGWLDMTVWISVHAGETGPLLTGQGELAHERDNLGVEQIQAAEFGSELRGLAFVFSVGTWRLYISPNNFRSATSHGDHEVRIRLDGAEVRIRDEFWGQFEREGSE
jgi:hypothetical protein